MSWSSGIVSPNALTLYSDVRLPLREFLFIGDPRSCIMHRSCRFYSSYRMSNQSQGIEETPPARDRSACTFTLAGRERSWSIRSVEDSG